MVGPAPTPTEVTNSYAIQPGTKTLVNVGSVGQPRDGDPRAAYVVYDAETQIFTFQRIAYTIEKTQERLPELEISSIHSPKKKPREFALTGAL